uniref:Urotensin 2B n=1 Tax=Coturnix japonica TaxID=93934 RepID=A0A8C2TTN7_COTJA
MRSVQLSLGVLAILTMTVYVPSTHGVPFFLLGKLEYRLDDTDNRVLPEREDTNHKDTLLPLLNKKFAWRTPGNFGNCSLMRVSQQLLKFKDQLSAEEGSEVADALESLSASQPKKRACFWKYCI